MFRRLNIWLELRCFGSACKVFLATTVLLLIEGGIALGVVSI